MRDLIRVASLVFISLQLAPSPDRSALVAFVDPIQRFAHGAGFGLDGKEIVVTADFIAQTQNVYTQHVLDSASTAQSALYQSKRSFLDSLAFGATLPRDLQVALYANSLLLDWLIDQVVPSDAAQLKVRNHLLISWLKRGLGYLREEDFALLPNETALFVQAGILTPGAAAAVAAPLAVAAAAPAPETDPKVLQARETYAKQCRKAGVPIPPTWGSPLWMKNGTLADPFISVSLKADVYVFESATPRGVCLALPRHKDAADADHELLGIICMGEQTDTKNANACFWDNQKDKKSTPIPNSGLFPLNTYFAAGQELDGGEGGTCTACHAGENSYVVHPDDPAFNNLTDIGSGGWYKPMVAASWPQNPGPDAAFPAVPAGEKKCSTCHNLPKIDKSLTPYCDSVLALALEKTMPPAGQRAKLGGPFPVGYRYQTHNMYLAQVCADAKK